MATFARELEGLPTAEIGGQALPRQLGQRHYTGVGLWNSRSANLLTALRAMLGDDAAYVETPHFTVRRLQLRHGKGTSAYRAALADAIYPSRTHGGWGGYRPFIAAAGEIDAHAEAVAAERNASTASDAAAISALRRAARGSNAAAAHLARALIDRIFTKGDDGGRAYRTSMLRALNEYADVAAEQPHDSLVLWSTVYPWVAARFYGPSTIVYEPDIRGRGADLNYIGELNRTGVDVGSRHRAGKVMLCFLSRALPTICMLSPRQRECWHAPPGDTVVRKQARGAELAWDGRRTGGHARVRAPIRRGGLRAARRERSDVVGQLRPYRAWILQGARRRGRQSGRHSRTPPPPSPPAAPRLHHARIATSRLEVASSSREIVQMCAGGARQHVRTGSGARVG